MIIIEGVYMANDFMTFQFDDNWFTPKEDNKKIMIVEDYLAMDYDTLKEYIYKNPDTPLLKESSIKKKLIDSPRKYDFIWFVQDANGAILASLLDEEGIHILQSSTDVVDKLNAIITCETSCHFAFQSDIFCEMVLLNWYGLDTPFHSLNEKEAISFLQYLDRNYPKKVLDLFPKLSAKTQVEILKTINFSLDRIGSFLRTGRKEAIEYILTNDFRIHTLSDFSFSELYTLATKKVAIPFSLFHQKSFIEKISTIGNVKDYRYLLNALSASNDVSEIELARKEYYERQFSSYDKEEQMLKLHLTWYQEISNRMESGEEFFSFLDANLVPFYGMGSEEFSIRNKIFSFYSNKDKEGLKNFFRQESRLQITNMVIDYHFAEIPYNFFLDLRELVHFQEGEGRTLLQEEIDAYSKLLSLDDLSYEEVMKIHAHLKEYDMIEKYYDHFRSAKDKQASLIEEAMLTESSVQKYKNEILSAQAGVPVYVLDGDEFYAFVKSSHTSKNMPLDSNYRTYSGDGGSYSLDGSNKLKTFKDPREIYNFIYKSIPKSQIVHTYPADSYSLYKRDLDTSTKRIYELLTPKELVGKSNSYNEILVAVPNPSKPQDELQASLEAPELLGIYCYDTITDNDIISAKNMGIGIVLVKTKNYQIDTSNRMRLMDTHLNGGSQSKYDYLQSIHENDMESRRK